MSGFSIHDFFSGGGVLVTGASGYVGGLVLEKLLRCTDVDKVYVMLRQKKGEDIQTRLDKMINSSPLMHLLRGNPVLQKVRAVAGDMTAAGLGISLADRQLLQREVQTVIHCAADIRLEVGIQELLRANYEGTRQLLDMARSFNSLNAFVHVSSAYTNMNATPGSLVKEAIYPLSYGDQAVCDHELVQELLSMPAHNANLRAEGMLAQWGFPNNYTLSKHLAEYMVADYQKYFNLPVAICRPTLISSCARDPYPGYTGNFAGHVGATLAFMAGLFNSPHASNYKATNVWDVIPSDVVANVILACAAAVGQGAAADCIATPTRDGRVITDSAICSSAERAAAATFHTRAAAISKQTGSRRGAINVSAFSTALPEEDTSADVALRGSSDQVPSQQHGGKGGDGKNELLIIHCGSSTTYPLTIMESWNWGFEVYGAWPALNNLVMGTCVGPMPADHEPNPGRAAYYMYITGLKIWLAGKILGWMKQDRVARKLAVGFESFKIINQPKTDVNLRFSSANMQRMASLLEPSERDEFLLLWKPVSTPAAAATVPGAAPRFALTSAAAKGSSGSPLQEEAGGIIKVATDVGRHGDLSPSGSSSDAELLSSDGEFDAGSNASSIASLSLHRRARGGGAGRQQHGAKLTAQQQEELRKMREVPIEWRAFHINLGAFLYCTQFKMALPPNVMPITNPEVYNWLNIKPADRVIHHNFTLYK